MIGQLWRKGIQLDQNRHTVIVKSDSSRARGFLASWELRPETVAYAGYGRSGSPGTGTSFCTRNPVTNAVMLR